MRASSKPKRIGLVVGEVLEKHGIRKQVERMGVIDLWPEIVGEQVARVTKVKGVDDATLIVEVRNSAWLMELSMLKDEFLERVNERLEEAPVNRIVFVLAETG